MPTSDARRIGLSAALFVTGCGFAERSFILQQENVEYLRPASGAGDRLTARDWLPRAHAQLGHLLPASAPPALCTDDLRDAQGRPADVLGHFGVNARTLRTLFGNWGGLQHTAQLVGTEMWVDTAPPPWPGFRDAWIPVNDRLSLAARLGFAGEDAQPRSANCIVILPGLFGDNGIWRTRDLAVGLRACGFHVLALELRGHGQTEARFPNVFYNFGAQETADLMAVSEWLQRFPQVRETGLVGYCWGANLAVLAAWYDGRPPDHPSITEKLARYLPPRSAQRHYRAGVLAFSPVVRFEDLIDDLDTPRAYLIDPVLGALQRTIRERMTHKQYGQISGSLRRLIEFEYAGSELDDADGVRDGLRFLRLVPHRGESAGNKLACVRVPLLIVHAANDPLIPAQDIADFLAGVDNPNVAALMLPGGGHIGFAAYAKSYYFSLIVNFFSARTGPVAVDPEPARPAGTKSAS